MRGEGIRTDVARLLALRHRTGVLVIDAPAGYDRSRLIRGAVAEAPSDAGVREAMLEIGNGWTPLDVVAATAAQLHQAHDAEVASSSASFARWLGGRGPVCLVVDQLHRGGEELIRWFGDLCRRRPPEVHLVLGGVGLEGLGVAELSVGDQASLVGPTDLSPAVDGDAVDRWPAGVRALASGRVDTALAVLRDALSLDVAAGAEKLVATLLAAEVTQRGVAEAVAGVLDGCSVWDLRRLPLVTVDRVVVDIHPWWRQVVRTDAEVPAHVYDAASQAAFAIGDLGDAGRHAVRAGSSAALRRVLRVALSTQPPQVSPVDLREWAESQVLAPEDPHAWWLDAATTAAHGGPLDHVAERYEAARAAFEQQSDLDAEISVSLAAAIVARRRDDVGTLARFLGRAETMLAACREEVRAPTMLGHALLAQMSGDPRGALDVLERVPAGSLRGDWAAQLAMMRGTNLLLLGRSEEAIVQLDRATGLGGAWSYLTALDLLATARWRNGDPVGALAEVDRAVVGQGAATEPDHPILVTRAVMLAAAGDPTAADVLSRMPIGEHNDEVDRLLRVARAMVAIEAGDLDGAAAILRDLRAPTRAVRSTTWLVALDTALTGDPTRWDDVVADHGTLRSARDAGLAARRFLDGGPPPPDEHRPFLPAAWHGPTDTVVEIRLLGGGEVRRNRRVVEHRNWERSRVRELCLFLSVNRTVSRDLAAELLWPDLPSPAAAKNLRVTLAYLLDVIDPDRPRGGGSRLLQDRDVLRFVDGDRLRIDVRDVLGHAEAVLAAASAGDVFGVVGAARRLVSGPRGRPLGGSRVGQWADPHEQLRRDVILRAAAAGGPVALEAGHPALAEALGRRGLEEDPWAERLHQLVIRSRLQRDDLDGARRSLREALRALGELGVRPEPATDRLARQLGVPVPVAGP
jgi:DNA-binding SARP family transcriptional activator